MQKCEKNIRRPQNTQHSNTVSTRRSTRPAGRSKRSLPQQKGLTLRYTTSPNISSPLALSFPPFVKDVHERHIQFFAARFLTNPSLLQARPSQASPTLPPPMLTQPPPLQGAQSAPGVQGRSILSDDSEFARLQNVLLEKYSFAGGAKGAVSQPGQVGVDASLLSRPPLFGAGGAGGTPIPPVPTEWPDGKSL